MLYKFTDAINFLKQMMIKEYSKDHIDKLEDDYFPILCDEWLIDEVLDPERLSLFVIKYPKEIRYRFLRNFEIILEKEIKNNQIFFKMLNLISLFTILYCK